MTLINRLYYSVDKGKIIVIPPPPSFLKPLKSKSVDREVYWKIFFPD